MSPATRGSQNQEVPFSQESQRRCFLRRSRSFLVKLLNLSIHMHAAAPKNGIHLFCQCPRCPGGRADRMWLGPAPGRRHISADFGERRPLRSSRLAGALLGLWRRSWGRGGELGCTLLTKKMSAYLQSDALGDHNHDRCSAFEFAGLTRFTAAWFRPAERKY